MVFGSTQVQNSGSKQTPLHAGLDLHRRIGNNQLLEGSEVAAVIFQATKLPGEREINLAVFNQQFELA